jgi:hypothetical protein
MDLFASTLLLSRGTNFREGFSGAGASPAALSRPVDWLSLLVSVLLGIYAAYLSWTSNTELGIHVGVKAVYAFFAFLFGMIYLANYFFLKRDVLGKYVALRDGLPEPDNLI